MRVRFAVAMAVATFVGCRFPQVLPAQSSPEAVPKPVEETAKGLILPDLPQLDVSDPKLREIYEHYLDIEPEDFEPWPGWALEIRADWKRRGDSATPMLLRILEKNINKIPGVNLLERVDSGPVKTLDRAPFVSWARNAIDEKLDQLDQGFCVALSDLLVHHGDSDDFARLVRIKVAKPKVGAIIDAQLKSLVHRLRPSH